MAMTNRAAGEVTWMLRDETGSTAPFQLGFPAATAVATVQAAVAALRPLVAAITSCIIVSESITYSAIDPAAPAPAAGSRVENKGTFVFVSAQAAYTRLSLPGIAAGALTVDGRIDEDDPDVAAFVAAVQGAPWSDSRGSDIVQLVKAYQKFRSSTRKMLPSKREPDIDTTDDSAP